MTIETLTVFEGLNRFKLTDEEAAIAMKVSGVMESEVAVLEDMGTRNTEATVHRMPMTNVLREVARFQAFAKNQLPEGALEHNKNCRIVSRLVK